MGATGYTFEQIICGFWSKVERREDGCWIWMGSNNYRYGHFGLKGKKIRSHRFSFFLFNGRWPENEIDHLCHEKLCVRPDHLRDVDHKTNMNSRLCSKICKRGHKLEDPNLYYYGNGRRRCLTCIKDYRKTKV